MDLDSKQIKEKIIVVKEQEESLLQQESEIEALCEILSPEIQNDLPPLEKTPPSDPRECRKLKIDSEPLGTKEWLSF